MRRVAITGSVGSGKSFVAEILSGYGIPHLDADAVVHDLYKSDQRLRTELEFAFGKSIFIKNGDVDRKELGKIVFADKGTLLLLNAIVHKYVKIRCNEWYSNLEKDGIAIGLFEAPQLFEAGMENDFDCIICVSAKIEKRIERICQRDNCGAERAKAIIENQQSDEEYRSKSDFVICTDDGYDVNAQCSEVFLKLLSGCAK